MTLFFQDTTYKVWKDFMTNAYYAAPGAVKGSRRLHEKGQKVSKTLLKKLEGIIFPEFYKIVATEMQDERRTLQSLPKSIGTILVEQWVMMHLDHPNNIQYVRPEKAKKALVVLPHSCIFPSPIIFLSKRHAHPPRGCSTREASLGGDSWYMGLLEGT